MITIFEFLKKKPDKKEKQAPEQNSEPGQEQKGAEQAQPGQIFYLTCRR